MSRRQMLAASSFVAIGNLSGCLGRVAGATTHTGASPAATFAGFGGRQDVWLIPPGEPSVRHLTPSISADLGVLSGDVELEAWFTTSSAKAQDYNSVRAPPARGPDGDEDGHEERSRLYEYFAGNPTIGERFTVTLPDARLLGGNGSLEGEVTPGHVIDYITGHSKIDAEGNVYSWGGAPRAAVGSDDDDEDDEDESCEETGTYQSSTETMVFCWGNTHETAFSEPLDTGGNLESSHGDVSVVVTNTPPTAEDGPSSLAVTASGEAYVPRNLNEWGDDEGPSGATPTIVCQILVKPRDCPEVFPALLYLRRCKHDAQYIYTGGWVIDDAALYENSVTLLTAEGPNTVAGIPAADLDGDGIPDSARRRLGDEENHRNARLFNGDLTRAVDSGVISKTDYNSTRSNRRKNEADLDGDGGENDEHRIHCVVTHLDASILHLTDAEGTSDHVKFKAGSELSKSVN